MSNKLIFERMKPNEKIEILNKVADECNPEHEALFSIYATHKKGDYFAVGDMNLVRGGIYEILNNGTVGEEGDPKTELAWSILGAIRDLRDEGVDIEALLDAFDEDEEEVDCPECEHFHHCDNERAKAWRTILETEGN